MALKDLKKKGAPSAELPEEDFGAEFEEEDTDFEEEEPAEEEPEADFETMIEALEEAGYTVTPPDSDMSEDDLDEMDFEEPDSPEY